MRLLMTCLALLAAAAAAGEPERAFRWQARSRVPSRQGERVRSESLRWDPARTAVIVIDMWDRHWCRSASRRTAELAPRADRFVAAARERGALIIHAPSGCMAAYEGHPARRRAQGAPRPAALPEGIDRWCYQIPSEAAHPYPIDQTDGGCDDEPRCKESNAWTRQIEAIRVRDEDAVSDSGVEVWSLLQARAIEHVLVLGVHTNMCVLGRPFGLRNLSRAGKQVLLVRDLTDTMYNPRARPYVPHHRGTELIVEHIERCVCPTVTSDQLIGGRPFRFPRGDA